MNGEERQQEDSEADGVEETAGLDVLKDLGAINRTERDFLQDLTATTVDAQAPLVAEGDSLVEDLVSGALSYDRYRQHLKDVGLYDTEISVRTSSHVVRNLYDGGLLRKSSNGYCFTEPWWPYLFRILDLPERPNAVGEPLAIICRSVRWLCRKLGTHRHLENRYWLAHDIAARVGQESAVVFSMTPSIFNPFEFDPGSGNHTKRFTDMLLRASERVVYVWNRDAVAEQIRSHVASSRCPNVNALKRKYIDHFSRYASLENLEVFWGDNSQMTKAEASMAYVSETRLVTGFRVAERLSYGIDLDRSRIRTLVLGATLTVAGVTGISLTEGGLLYIAGAALLDKILGPQNFQDIRQQLVEGGRYEPLSGMAPEQVVDTTFAYALGTDSANPNAI